MGDPLKALGQPGEVAGLYRLVTGFLIMLLVGLVGFIGTGVINSLDSIRGDVSSLRNELSGVRPEVAANKANIEMINGRQTRANDRHSELDRRVTVIETRMETRR